MIEQSSSALQRWWRVIGRVIFIIRARTKLSRIIKGEEVIPTICYLQLEDVFPTNIPRKGTIIRRNISANSEDLRSEEL